MADFPDGSPFFTPDEVERHRARNPDTFTPERFARILAHRRRKARMWAIADSYVERRAAEAKRRLAEQKARDRALRIAQSKIKARRKKSV